MISFRPTEDEKAFTEVAKDFAKDKIRPMARECENNRIVDQKLVDVTAELGFLSLELPEYSGGLELPLITQVQILQALSYGDLDIVQGFPGAGDAASIIRIQRNNPVFNADTLDLTGNPTVAFIDIENANEPWGEKLEIRYDGDGYILDGTSLPVRMASFAQYVLVAAQDNRGVPVILWLNNADSWIVEKGDYRLGLLASGLGRISFDSVKITGKHVLAEEEAADEILRQVRSRIRILQAAKEVGLMEAALDYATEYTAERKAFGQEIAKFQGVSFRVAAMAMETRIANHFVREAAVKADKYGIEAEGEALRALFRAHRAVRYVTDSTVQLLGGHGFVQDFPAEKWMRDAQAQVALYGREKYFLEQRGEQLIAGKKEVAVP
ncbi:acyl-CoA dehydrogenase family protein [Virgibacillus siamensis]|uniref:acyl-CoA dehydrogenase family protein n=1 Tax=Virgibacillus siamensis TaxID=480071 RepID=UPI000985DE5F|nr:acyl-CoA dehydrogenase family protein [Virgibacillus siamensis]